MSTNIRTGILGGTFDPIHLGHHDVAMAAKTALMLDTVLLLPSGEPPHRHQAPVASSLDRLTMVKLAAETESSLKASSLELRSEGPSYTSQTLKLLTRGKNRSQFFFIIGADAFAEISTWHNYPEVLKLTHFVVVSRPGHPASQLKQQHPALADRIRTATQFQNVKKSTLSDINRSENQSLAVWLIEARTRDVSSSKIRMRRSKGLPIDDLVTPSVATYILQHQLYTNTTSD